MLKKKVQILTGIEYADCDRFHKNPKKYKEELIFFVAFLKNLILETTPGNDKLALLIET